MNKKIELNNFLSVCKLSKLAKIPTKATHGSAGFDICACINNDMTLNPFETVLIPTGIAISLPSNEYVALIFPRSGISIKYGITLANAVGVIDSDYRGEISVGLHNISKNPYIIKNGDRIAQLLLMKVENLSVLGVSNLDDTERGIGGFGSTGK